MNTKASLTVFFALIFVAMLVCTGWAATHQSVQSWSGLQGPERYWTIATLLDAYCGFITFYVWVFYKEPRWLPRIAWFIAIMALGNIAMSAYVLRQLLRPMTGGIAGLLSLRNP